MGRQAGAGGRHGKAGRDGLRLGVDWAHLSVAPETLNHQGLGSNNWAVGPSRSASGKAMVVNDPHLDSRILPGYWHPVGLFTPEIQAIGAALPGMPGILVGRTKHVAFGVTNAYGDVQDVYIETLDPNDKSRYLHGGKSTAFTVVEETIRIKDKAAPGGLREQPLRIRYTVHGPVISDHPGLGSGGDKILALRSTDAEVLAPVLGIEGLLTAPDAAAFDREVQKIDLMMFNFVFGDDKGSIGHRASGAVPVRAGADGSLPRVAPADGSDDWTGYIPEGPHARHDRSAARLGRHRQQRHHTRGLPLVLHQLCGAGLPLPPHRPGAGQCEADDGGRPVETHDGRPQPAERPPAHDHRGRAEGRPRPARPGGPAGEVGRRGPRRPGGAAGLPGDVPGNRTRHLHEQAGRGRCQGHAVDLVFLATTLRRADHHAGFAVVRQPRDQGQAGNPGRRDPRRRAARARQHRGPAGQRPGGLGLGQGAHAELCQPPAAQWRGAGAGGWFHRAASGQRRDAEPRRVRLPEAVCRQFLPVDAGGGRFFRSGQDQCRGGRRRERAPFPAAPERSGAHPGRGRTPFVVVQSEAGRGPCKFARHAGALTRLPEAVKPGSHRHAGPADARLSAAAGIHAGAFPAPAPGPG
ncbi:MAG: penicillin acylase family protein [Comamonadaceae bacterium]|nr:penicillin acylase family protein [Comamonadaceae bacterium]